MKRIFSHKDQGGALEPQAWHSFGLQKRILSTNNLQSIPTYSNLFGGDNIPLKNTPVRNWAGLPLVASELLSIDLGQPDYIND
jgi:hypothetical protein